MFQKSLIFALGFCALSHAGTLKVMTANVFRGINADHSSHPLFKERLDWKVREQKLQDYFEKLVVSEQVDIVAFQETRELPKSSIHAFECTLKKKGYEFDIKYVNASNLSKRMSLGYDRKKFSLLESGKRYFEKKMANITLQGGLTGTKTVSLVSPWGNIFQYAKFKKYGDSKEVFYVFHIHFNLPNNKARSTLNQWHQARETIKFVREINKEHLPFVLLGDSNLYEKTVQQPFNDGPEIKKFMQRELKISDAKSLVKGPKWTWHPDFEAQVNYQKGSPDIMYYSSQYFSALNTRIFHKMVTEDHLSDHAPVLTELKFK